MLTEGIAKNTMHKIYAVDILPNAIIEQALFTEDYRTSEITENFIKLETVVDVNVLFDKSVLPQAIDSKEYFTDVVITNFFISRCTNLFLKDIFAFFNFFYWQY